MHSLLIKFSEMRIMLCVMFASVFANTVADTELTLDADFYTAGVVEFRPIVSGMSAANMLQAHLQGYIEIINSAEAAATDIIVFPEGTLNSAHTMTYLPHPKERRTLCSNGSKYAEFLIQLSCLARDKRKYLVINLTEQENCTSVRNDPRPCAPSGLNTYNTNVVFDREGRVISRYRKVHIYTEQRNTTLQPEHEVFDTDFGVRFGHFICFDMLFYTPALPLVRTFGVQHFIFTSMFYSELPFLTAVQMQQSWAWANQVYLLAAGASNPAAGMTGSGIYAAQGGILNALMLAAGPGERRLLVAKVPKNPKSATSSANLEATKIAARVNTPRLKLMKDYQMENYTTQLLNATETQHVQQTLCDETGFCCHFYIAIQALNTSSVSRAYTYRLALFNGERRYEQLEWSSLQICAIIACTNDSLLSCGEIFDDSFSYASNFEFIALKIEANFSKSEQLLLMPNSLNTDLYPLTPSAAHWQVVDGGSFYNARFSLQQRSDNLLTFGIYGNYYDGSAEQLPPNLVTTTTIVLIGVLILTLLIKCLIDVTTFLLLT